MQDETWRKLKFACITIMCALTGCVSIYHTTVESVPLATAKSDSECSIRIREANSHFRAEGVYSYNWGPPSAFGYSSLELDVSNLATKCAPENNEQGIDARVEFYFLESSSKAYAWFVGLPLIALSAATLGVLPIPMFRSYTVCVQSESSDGIWKSYLHRAHLVAIENMWGGSNTNLRRGEDESRTKKENLLRELAKTAWTGMVRTGGEEIKEGQKCEQLLALR